MASRLARGHHGDPSARDAQGRQNHNILSIFTTVATLFEIRVNRTKNGLLGLAGAPTSRLEHQVLSRLIYLSLDSALQAHRMQENRLFDASSGEEPHHPAKYLHPAAGGSILCRHRAHAAAHSGFHGHGGDDLADSPAGRPAWMALGVCIPGARVGNGYSGHAAPCYPGRGHLMPMCVHERSRLRLRAASVTYWEQHASLHAVLPTHTYCKDHRFTVD